MRFTVTLCKMNGCPACIIFEETWKKITQELDKLKIPYKVYEGDNIPNSYNITGVPTVIIEDKENLDFIDIVPDNIKTVEQFKSYISDKIKEVIAGRESFKQKVTSLYPREVVQKLINKTKEDIGQKKKYHQGQTLKKEDTESIKNIQTGGSSYKIKYLKYKAKYLRQKARLI